MSTLRIVCASAEDKFDSRAFNLSETCPVSNKHFINRTVYVYVSRVSVFVSERVKNSFAAGKHD